MARDIVQGSDFNLTLNGARLSATGAYLNAATVTYTLYTAAGVSVSTGTLTYVTSSNGNYLGVIESTVTSTLTAGASYYVRFTLAEGTADLADRLDLIARAPGSVIIDAQYWMDQSGITVTGADLTSVEQICEQVGSALLSMCDPIQIVPLTLTLAAFDAPPKLELYLPRPIRSISAIYVRYGANGDSSLLTAADLLTNFTDYYSPVTNKRKNWNGSGIVYRRRSSIWGLEYRRGVGNLAYSVDPNLGAVFVSGEFGPASVDPAVKGVAFNAAMLMYQRRKTAAPIQSEGWGGYNYSLAGGFTAEAALNSPDVLETLRKIGALPVHVC